MSDSEVNSHIDGSINKVLSEPADSSGKEPGGSSNQPDSQVESDVKHDDDDNLDRYLAEFLKAHNLAGKFGPDDREEQKHQAEQAHPTPKSGEADFAVDNDGADHESVKAMPNIAVADPPLASAAASSPPRKPRPARRPPSSPPESPEDLKALRQLAVSIARGAIKVHAFKQSVGVLRFYFLVGVAALSTSILLALGTPDTRSNAYLVAVGSFALAAVSCLGFLRRSRKAGRAPVRAVRGRVSAD